MTTTRDPLAVLRAFSGTVCGQVCCNMPVGGGMDENGNGEPPSCCGQPFDSDELPGAIACVVELVDAASFMLGAVYRGPDQDGLRAALQPFTPGQDSEGGGHG